MERTFEEHLDKFEARLSDFERRLVQLKNRVDSIFKLMATKEDISNLRIEVVQLESRMFKWGVGFILTNIAISTTIVFAILRMTTGM